MIADHILPLDTQAILLLCGYFGNNDKRQPKPLSLTEYNKLTLQLRSTGLRPRDLVEDSSESTIKMVCPGQFDAH